MLIAQFSTYQAWLPKENGNEMLCLKIAIKVFAQFGISYQVWLPKENGNEMLCLKIAIKLFAQSGISYQVWLPKEDGRAEVLRDNCGNQKGKRGKSSRGKENGGKV